MNASNFVTLIGVGNCGSQISNLAKQKYPDLFQCISINTSESDLAMIKNTGVTKFKIGKQHEVEGSGKNRSKMKEYLRSDINNLLTNAEIQETISNSKYVFVISSTAGGTGSGAAPVLIDILKQVFPDVNFILVAVLPQLSSSLMEQGNTIEYLSELYDTLDPDTTYMVYDNDSAGDIAPTKILETVNNNIVEDIRILTGTDNYPTPYESIDEADMESILTTPGRIVVARLTRNINEKYLEDNNLDEMLIKAIKQSSHAETDRNKKVIRWGMITYLSEGVNHMLSSYYPKLEEFIGTPVERFNHNAINSSNNDMLNFVYLIASGMSPINDRAKRIDSRIEELKSALATDESSKYIMSGESVSYDVVAERKKMDKRNRAPEIIDPKDIFKKFMK